MTRMIDIVYISIMKDVFLGKSKELYELYKDEEITSLMVWRHPFSDWLHYLIHILSGGVLFGIMKRLGYTYLHLVNIVFNERWLLNKNGFIMTFDEVMDTDFPKNNIYIIQIKNKKQTIHDFLTRSYMTMGETYFRGYDFVNNNCHHFICSLLEHNGYLTDELEQFIDQNAPYIEQHLPKYLFYVTDLFVNITYQLYTWKEYVKQIRWFSRV